MINSIIQIIIENKKILEKSIKESGINVFRRNLRKMSDETGRKALVGILEKVNTVLFEDSKRKIEYETKYLIKTSNLLYKKKNTPI